MAVEKLSQINSGTTVPIVPSTDQIVIVRGGNTDLLGSTAIPPTGVVVSGTTKTLALSDANTIQGCSNGSTQTITIPPNASVAFPINTAIAFEQNGAGTVTVVGATGVTVNGVNSGQRSTSGQYTGIYARQLSADVWVVEGGGIGVTAFNTLTGAITLAGGAGISLSTTGNTVTLNAAVASVADSGAGTTTISNSGGAVSVAINLNNANAWTAAQTIAVNSASAFAVGLGIAHPAFNVDTTTATSATGINIKSAASGDGVAMSVITSGTNENVTFDAAGSGTISLNATATGGVNVGKAAAFFGVYNTTDMVTNFERMEMLFFSNVALLRTNKGGSGTARALALCSEGTNSNAINIPAASTNPILLAAFAVASAYANGRVNVAQGVNNTVASGTHATFNVSENFAPTATATTIFRCIDANPTVNFSNGTPGSGNYEIYRARVVETALPTGTNYLARWSAGSAGTTDKFLVDNSGNIYTASTTIIKSITGFTNNAGSSAGTLTNAPAVGNPTAWIPINDNGTIRNIPAW